MSKSFPYTKYHFDVSFLFPQLKFNAAFQSVSGLSFSSGEGGSIREGGNNNFALPLTAPGSSGSLTLKRGFTEDMGLYNWCEQTLTTMKTQPCNILVSLLDNKNMPAKNWLIFNAFPTSWTAGDFTSTDQNIMVESVALTYHNFILI